MRLSFTLCTLALFVSACQSASQYRGDEHSSYYLPPTGSTLVLNQELTIPAEAVGVYIQDGRVQPASQLRRYYPHCKFDMNTRRTGERKVVPNSFSIVRALQDVAERDAPTMGYAKHSFFIKVADYEQGGSPLGEFTTHMYLQSKTQPDVYQLTCLQWGDLPDDSYLSIADIRRTLGSIFTLEVPPPK